MILLHQIYGKSVEIENLREASDESTRKYGEILLKIEAYEKSAKEMHDKILVDTQVQVSPRSCPKVIVFMCICNFLMLVSIIVSRFV